MAIVVFIVTLSLLVLFHEAGHFLAARLFGVKAEEFGIGFPPRIFGFVKDRGKWKYVGRKQEGSYKHTIWSLNWLPLGGFVRIKGEQEDGINDADSIHSKSIWKRIVIIAAGVCMNWLLAVVLFTILFSVGALAELQGLPEGADIKDRAVIVTEVLKGSPAEKAGLEIGDEIFSLDGQSLTDSEKVRSAIKDKGLDKMEITVKREDFTKNIQATPEFVQEIGRPGLGIALTDVGVVSYPLHLAAWNAVVMTAGMTKAVVFAFGDIFRDLVVSQKVAEGVSGPIGIAVIAGKMAKQGFSSLIQFAAVLSINLAVINFLPIPALDGGRVMFLIIEKVRRRPISRRLEISIHNVAFLVLILLIILITARDIMRFGGVILGGVKGLVGM